MKKVAVCLVAALFSTSAFGATVEFVQTGQEVVEGAVDMTTTFDLFVSGAGTYDSADLVVGSNDVVLTDFTFSADWNSTWDTTFAPMPGPVEWASSLYLTASNAPGNLIPIVSLLVGSLTVDADGLLVGDYSLAVDTGIDGFSNLGNVGDPEPIVGLGSLGVTPEPATLALLGLGGLVALRRRRR